MDLVQQLKRDEGMVLRAYKDSVGKTTIGVGRNLDDVGISADEAEYLLANDIARVKIDVGQYLPWTSRLDLIRLAVLHNLCFNMGIHALLAFRKMLAHMQNGDYAQAANELLNSKYAKQVGSRAERLAKQLITGEWV